MDSIPHNLPQMASEVDPGQFSLRQPLYSSDPPPLQSFIDCIQTGEFMHVYNAIIVMKEILDVFPMASVNEHSGSNINAAIDRFLETEERGDLKILARS